MTRRVHLHAFCSAGGGVGKSTLAVASARILAHDPAGARVPVLIDVDLTGASLADGLRLCAPRLPQRPDGTLDLDSAPTGQFFSLAETFAQRQARNTRLVWHPGAYETRPLCIPFLNDALAYTATEQEQECRIDAMLWRHEEEDGVRYLPSSSLPDDAAVALGWLHGQDEPDRLLCRLCWILDELLLRMPQVTDLILDLPPGLAGLSRLVLDLVRYLDDQVALPAGYPRWGESLKFRVNPVLVMTADRSGWLPALEYQLRQGARLLPCLNDIASVEDERAVLSQIRADLGEAVARGLPVVRRQPVLAQLLRGGAGAVALDPALSELRERLRLGDTDVG